MARKQDQEPQDLQEPKRQGCYNRACTQSLVAMLIGFVLGAGLLYYWYFRHWGDLPRVEPEDLPRAQALYEEGRNERDIGKLQEAWERAMAVNYAKGKGSGAVGLLQQIEQELQRAKTQSTLAIGKLVRAEAEFENPLRQKLAALKDPSTMTDAQLKAIIAEWPYLVHLDLRGCTGVTDITPLERAKNLKRLDLRGLEQIPPQQIRALKEALPTLTIEGP